MSAFTQGGNLEYPEESQEEEEVEENNKLNPLMTHRVWIHFGHLRAHLPRSLDEALLKSTAENRALKHSFVHRSRCRQLLSLLEGIKIVLKRCVAEIKATYKQNCVIRDGVLCLCSCQFDSSPLT